MRITLIIFALCAFVSSSFAVPPAEEDRFIAEAKKALNAKDIDALLRLHYFKGVPEDIKQVHIESLSWIVGPPVIEITLAKPDSDKEFEVTQDGVTYRTTLPATRTLRVEFQAPPGGERNASFPVGEKDGKLFITVGAPAK